MSIRGKYTMVLVAVFCLLGLALKFEPGGRIGGRVQGTVAPLAPKKTTKRFAWTPGKGAVLGQRKIAIVARDEKNNKATKYVTINVLPSNKPNPAEPSKSPVVSIQPVLPTPSSQPVTILPIPVTYTYQAEKDHVISGPYTGIVLDSARMAAKISSKTDIIGKKIVVTPGDYWFDATVKDDKPGPVIFTVSINNQVWQTIRLEQNDNQYRTRRIGLLSNFSGGAVIFRLINDSYDKNNPTNEDKDVNFFLDEWSLTSTK